MTPGSRWVHRETDGHGATRRVEVTSTEGSWQAGVDGAQPGILLLADPKRAMEYRQEYYKGQAEDAARVLSLDMRAKRCQLGV
jgi:hypothetical protein